MIEAKEKANALDVLNNRPENFRWAINSFALGKNELIKEVTFV